MVETFVQTIVESLQSWSQRRCRAGRRADAEPFVETMQSRSQSRCRAVCRDDAAIHTDDYTCDCIGNGRAIVETMQSYRRLPSISAACQQSFRAPDRLYIELRAELLRSIVQSFHGASCRAFAELRAHPLKFSPQSSKPLHQYNITYSQDIWRKVVPF